MLRCDVARPLSKHPAAAVFFADAPAAELIDIGTRLAQLPGVRVCSAVSGPHNLIIDGWMRHVSDVLDFEVEVSKGFPQLTIGDRSVVLRTVKHVGRILNPGGSVYATANDLTPEAPTAR